MESLGKYLRSKRELKELSLEEVANVLKIKVWYLFAIEQDSFELLPTGGYDRKFLTDYAKHLGLESEEVIRRYQEEYKWAAISEPLDNPGKTQSPERRIAKGLIFVSIVLLFLFIAWRYQILSEHPEFLRFAREKRALKPTPSSSSPAVHIEEPGKNDSISSSDSERPSWLRGLKAMEDTETEPSLFEVTKAGTGMRIEKEDGRLVLVGQTSEFLCNGWRVYFLTRLETPRKGYVTHIWFREDKEYYRLTTEARPPAWSLYSYITLRPGLAGTWRAEVRDGNKILSQVTFKAIKDGPS